MSIENRAVRGLNIPRHKSSNHVYNEFTDLGACENHMNTLNACLTKTNFKTGDNVHSSCLELFENMKHSCGLRRYVFIVYWLYAFKTNHQLFGYTEDTM
jgi:hypothetical protein